MTTRKTSYSLEDEDDVRVHTARLMPRHVLLRLHAGTDRVRLPRGIADVMGVYEGGTLDAFLRDCRRHVGVASITCPLCFYDRHGQLLPLDFTVGDTHARYKDRDGVLHIVLMDGFPV